MYAFHATDRRTDGHHHRGKPPIKQRKLNREMLTKGFRLCHFMLTIPHARTPEVFCEMMSGLWAGGLPATTVEHGHNNLEADYARYPTRSFTPAARARRH